MAVTDERRRELHKLLDKLGDKDLMEVYAYVRSTCRRRGTL